MFAAWGRQNKKETNASLPGGGLYNKNNNNTNNTKNSKTQKLKQNTSERLTTPEGLNKDNPWQETSEMFAAWGRQNKKETNASLHRVGLNNKNNNNTNNNKTNKKLKN